MIKMNEDMLKQIIIDTIKGEEHLGENLKNQCVDYIEKLQNNWNELKKWLEEEHTRNISWYGSLTHHDKQYYLYKFGTTKDVLDNVQDKMQELQGDDKN